MKLLWKGISGDYWMRGQLTGVDISWCEMDDGTFIADDMATRDEIARAVRAYRKDRRRVSR